MATLPLTVCGTRRKLEGENLPDEADELLLWLGRFPVEHNHPRSLLYSKSKETQADPQKTTSELGSKTSFNEEEEGEVMVLPLELPLANAFDQLIKEGFSSAPVIDSQRNYVGFIDLLDVFMFIDRLFNLYCGKETLNTIEKTELWSKFFEGNPLVGKTVADVMNAPSWANKGIFNPVYKGFSTLYPIELMARTGLHRVPMLNKHNKITSIITQSMMISLIDQSLDKFGDICSLPLRRLTAGLVQELQTVSEQDTVIVAFERMSKWKINGLAVVNDKGVLVDSISIRDLRGIRSLAGKVAESKDSMETDSKVSSSAYQDDFKRLFMTVKEYKAILKAEFSIQTPPYPIYLTINNTFQELIKAMDDGNIHRVFIAEENSNGEPVPTHVCSQRDVLRFCLYKMGMSPHTIQE